ncbi:glycosyltransferase [Candidatus Methylomirabilis sp.]|uniref:glycosyltransferase family 2 protein n=1 Tax=Candidatus Methylomirabilis sp. TaxID=2032687 RepID=UPI002A5C202C|nr:glycosyltransferase [Candidatus Methylomirabilis sp.]
MNTLVTVVIPSYNHEKYVVAAVDSCLSQTYRDLEVIVVDDGSQDNSVNLLQTRYAGDPRVKIVTQQNNGAHAAINVGIHQASGEYIAILNSDDLFHSRRIEVLIQEAQQVDGIGSLVFSDLEFINDEGYQAPEHERAQGYRMLQQRCQETPVESLFLVGNVAMTSSNFFFPKTLFHAVGEFSALRYTHDWDWALRATAICPPTWVRENLLSYRVHGSNTIAESDIWPHIRENAFVHAKAILTLKQRIASMDNPSRVVRDVYTSLLHNESFLPLATLYFVVLGMAGFTEAQLFELVTASDKEGDLRCLADELSLPEDLFLSAKHLIEMKKIINSQAAMIEERWAAMQQMEAMVRERDETIASQTQMIEERWAAMQQMGQEIGNRDRRIAELQERLAD